jgi:TRAP-type C4-dicarboxylate transport system permease small subunit
MFLVLLVLLVIAQVVLRNFFRLQMLGSEELSRYFLICVIFFALPYTTRSGGNIVIPELKSLFPRKVRLGLELLISLCGFLVFALFAVSAILTIWQNPENKTAALGIPNILFFLPTLIGFTLMIFEYLLRFVSLIRTRNPEL